ncbi:MAG: hypothetical protein IJS45_11010 [Clostridia bacterium]|nr:hypothetical protein [Clostridia bacterium]
MALFHEGFLAAASGFTDSHFPLLYCDGDLTVVDMNSAANAAFGNKFRLADMTKYLSEEDTANVFAMLYSCAKFGEYDGAFVTAKTHGAREFTWTLVAPRSFLGEVFAEFRLFRTKREMLSSRESKALIFPVVPSIPVYSNKSGREGSALIGIELERTFAYNMLTNLYSSALEDSPPEMLDLAKTAKRIIAEATNYFNFNRLKWTLKNTQEDMTACPLVSRRCFINMIALVVSVFSDISGDGLASLEFEAESGGIRMNFMTKMRARDVIFVGDFNLSLLGKMFSGVGSRTSVLSFICSAYGAGYYAKVKDGDVLILSLVFSKDGVEESFEVKHTDRFDMNAMRESAKLIRCLGGFEK